ncbi:general transcription factor II-I repeat domain-containing protein 2A-like [Simochromis diagramma]|uniref:general transcription factor II-I repeat domain-containing protein 2A-like n=1 Tax=Simochromis diagramma TaxID=43689 RepID=UPI001A7ED1EF|nr:general transcription factor II-I repeat domain-containing protein 2A-like [Simochromis diagramma]
MEELDLDRAKLASITTDGAPCMVGTSRGLIGRMNREMEERGLTAPLQVHCIIHQQALCCKVLKWDSVMKAVVSCINFIRANGLKHRQFQQFLSELESAYGDVLYYTEVRWLSRGRVLRRFLEQVKKHNFTHLPATQNLSAENPAVLFPAEKCVEALEMLKAEFSVRFRQLHVHAKEIRLFQNPFVADIDEAQPFY